MLPTSGEPKSTMTAMFADAAQGRQSFRADHEIAALFRRSDLFVFPTLAELFRSSFSKRCPWVADWCLYRGGIPHQVDDQCAVLIARDDAGQLKGGGTGVCRL